MAYLSNNLKYLRNQQNLSQATLANLLFVTHQTISNHETGKSQPSLRGHACVLLSVPPRFPRRAEKLPSSIILFAVYVSSCS